jgi:hypothetical protein
MSSSNEPGGNPTRDIVPRFASMPRPCRNAAGETAVTSTPWAPPQKLADLRDRVGRLGVDDCARAHFPRQFELFIGYVDAVGGVQIRVADTACLNLDHDLAGTKTGTSSIFNGCLNSCTTAAFIVFAIASSLVARKLGL